MLKNIVPVLFAFVLAGVALAASPPDLINYQGVLRDSSDAPLDGDYDMVFRFHDDGGGGNEILVDSHLATNGEAVSVTGGLFNAQLGDGQVTDGSGPGTYTSLAEVFRDHAVVHLEIEVNKETLSPRVRMVSAGYALNAGHLNGMTSANFLDTSTGSQVKAGDLTVNQLTLTGEHLNLAGGGSIDGSAGDITIHGNSNFDDLFLQGGNDTTDGSIRIFGQGRVSFRSYNGDFEFSSTDSGLDTALLDTNGNLSLAGTLQVGSTTEPPTSYSRFGIATPWTSDINDQDDLLVRCDLAVGDNVYIGTSTIVGDDTPTSSQQFSSYGEADNKEAAKVNSWNDLYVEGTLEVDDEIYARVRRDSTTYTLSDSFHYTVIDHNNNGTTSEARWYHDFDIVSANQLAEIQEDGDLRIRGILSESVAFDIAESFLAVEPLEPGDLVSVDASRPDSVRRSYGEGDRAVIGVVSSRPGVLLGDAPFDPDALKNAWGEEIRQRYLDAREQLREEVLSLHPDLQAMADELESLAVGDDEAERRRLQFQDDVDGLALEMFFERRFVPVALAGRVPVKVDAGYGPIRIGDLLTASPTPGHAMCSLVPEPGTVIGKALEPLDEGTGTIQVLVMLR